MNNRSRIATEGESCDSRSTSGRMRKWAGALGVHGAHRFIIRAVQDMQTARSHLIGTKAITAASSVLLQWTSTKNVKPYSSERCSRTMTVYCSDSACTFFGNRAGGRPRPESCRVTRPVGGDLWVLPLFEMETGCDTNEFPAIHVRGAYEYD